MPKLERPTVRICTRVYADTLAHLDQIARAAPPKVSRDLIIREILSKYVEHIKSIERAKIDENLKQTAEPELEIDLSERAA